MPIIYPVETLPALPPAESGLHPADARAAYLSALAERDVHLALARHLGRHGVHKDFNYDDSPLVTSPIGVDQALRLKIHTSPFARYIVVVLTVQAMRYPNSLSDISALAGGVIIDATLVDHATDTVIDDDTGPGPGVRWQLSDGTLPIAGDSPAIDPSRSGPVLGNLVRSYPVFTVTTGWAVDDTASAFPTTPRPLAVGSYAGNVLRIELDTVNVRVLHADAWERFDPEVEI